jgi:hypothetical protein
VTRRQGGHPSCPARPYERTGCVLVRPAWQPSPRAVPPRRVNDYVLAQGQSLLLPPHLSAGRTWSKIEIPRWYFNCYPWPSAQLAAQHTPHTLAPQPSRRPTFKHPAEEALPKMLALLWPGFRLNRWRSEESLEPLGSAMPCVRGSVAAGGIGLIVLWRSRAPGGAGWERSVAVARSCQLTTRGRQCRSGKASPTKF